MRARCEQMHQLIDRKARRDQTASDVYRNDSLMADALQLRPHARESKDGERMHGHLLAADETFDRNIDESAHENRNHEDHRRRGGQMQLG